MAATLSLLLIFVSALLPSSHGHCFPTRCPYEPYPHYVCGTDGVTYDSECELKKAACVAAMNGNPIAQKHAGRCTQYGDYPSSCPPCPYEPYRPVCGSDGQTYGSRCEVQRVSCAENRHVTVVKEGPCYGGGQGGSQGGGHVGVILPGGLEISFNRCKRNCRHHHHSPQVCGSDGYTYENKCELEKASCRKHSLHVAYEGPCNNYGGGGGGGGAYQCNPYKQCPPFGPRVCASNGFDYKNKCELEKVTCVDRRIYEVPCYGSHPHPGPIHPGGSHIHPGGSNIHPGGSNIHPGGSNIHPGGSNIHPGGSNIHPGGPYPHPGPIHPGGSNIHPGGSNIHPGGSNIHPGGSNIHPGGPHIHPGGLHPGSSHGTGSLHEKPTKPQPIHPEKPHITLPGPPGGHYETPNKPHITLPGDSYDKPAKPHGTAPGSKAGSPRDAVQDQLRSTLGDEAEEEVEEVEEVETLETSLEDTST